MSDPNYHESRFAHDPRRDVLWHTLVNHHFAKRIPKDATVLDLGAGYGNFINQVQAKRRIAIDIWPGLAEHVSPGVEVLTGDVTDLSALEDGTVNYAFASNLLEHLHKDQIVTLLEGLKRKLAPGGVFTLLQPNYKYAYREYFDDYTHVSIFSDIAMADFLTANGFTPFEVKGRFLPLTIKGRLPVHPLLIRAYLMSPIKPMGKQMLISSCVTDG